MHMFRYQPAEQNVSGMIEHRIVDFIASAVLPEKWHQAHERDKRMMELNEADAASAEPGVPDLDSIPLSHLVWFATEMLSHTVKYAQHYFPRRPQMDAIFNARKLGEYALQLVARRNADANYQPDVARHFERYMREIQCQLDPWARWKTGAKL